MSVTVSLEPDAKHAAFNPVLWAATTDRSSVASFAAVTVDDNGGFVRFSKGGMTLIVNDVVSCTLYANSEINTDVLVTGVVAGTSFTSDLVWDAAFVGDSGTVTVNNQNLIIQVSVKVSGVVKAVKDVKDFSGFNFDLSKILQGLVTFDEIDLAGADTQSPNPSASSVRYTLTLQDKWTNKFGDSFSDTAINHLLIGGDAIMAFNIALNDSEVMTDFICSVATPGEFLTHNKSINIHRDETYQLAFITEDASIVVRFTRTTFASAVSDTDVIQAIQNDRGMILIDDGVVLVDTETLQITILEDSVDKFIMSETFTFTQSLKCTDGTRMEWKNLLGGFDAYTFVELENKENTKVSNYQNVTWNTAQIRNIQKTKLIGVFSGPTFLSWLSELLTSRKITKDGDNAVVVNENLIPLSRNFKKPILTIQTDDKITN